MAILTRIIEALAVLLVAAGAPAKESTLYALIVIYLLVTGIFVALPTFILLRRRQRQHKSSLSPSDLES